MKCVLLCELVSDLARNEFDLIAQDLDINQCAACAFQDSKRILVFERFYPIALPPDSGSHRYVRLRKLGRKLASRMPGLYQDAIKHYG